jgi:cytochrome b subunit of formate dehydrogenase
MSNKKAVKLWVVNVASFVLFLLLSITGLANWLLLPRGYETSVRSLISLRHFLRDIHEWAALGFIIIIAIHLVMHWPYIRGNLKK